MTTGADLIAEVRTSAEDVGDTVTDNATGDGSTKLFKTSLFPIKTNSEYAANNGALTVGGTQQIPVTQYAFNYDNGEILFVTAPGNGVAIVATYVKVTWRDERIISALNSGVRDMYARGAYKRGEAYILLASLKYDYDLGSAADVAPTASFAGDFTFPTDYNPATARTDLQKPQTRIHFAEYHPYGANRPWHPYHSFGRTTLRNFHIDGDPTPNDAIRLTYTAPFTPIVLSTDTVDVPDELYMAPVWYALSTLMEKKEARRARADGYNVMSNANANPPGTQAQTAEDYFRRYLAVMDGAMRPMRMTQRRRMSGWQWTETIR
jgi:hypothetical protein